MHELLFKIFTIQNNYYVTTFKKKYWDDKTIIPIIWKLHVSIINENLLLLSTSCNYLCRLNFVSYNLNKIDLG